MKYTKFVGLDIHKDTVAVAVAKRTVLLIYFYQNPVLYNSCLCPYQLEFAIRL